MKVSQITDTLVMVFPKYFGFNTETAESNIFQHDPSVLGRKAMEIRSSAITEFSQMVDDLSNNDIRVLVLPNKAGVRTPGAVFPNNWFTHHQDNTLVLYPMLAPSRRAERQEENLLALLATINVFPTILDFTGEEKSGHILEGTGSMVLDRVHKVAFAIESQRTTRELFFTWCHKKGYTPYVFQAFTDPTHPVYHTNIFMCIGEDFCVYCPELLGKSLEKEKLELELLRLKKELIPISKKQLLSFCANMLQVKSTSGRRKLILSTTAFNAYSVKQRKLLEKHGDLIVVSIPTIENVEGGGARCMIAEIFPMPVSSGKLTSRK